MRMRCDYCRLELWPRRGERPDPAAVEHGHRLYIVVSGTTQRLVWAPDIDTGMDIVSRLTAAKPNEVRWRLATNRELDLIEQCRREERELKEARKK